MKLARRLAPLSLITGIVLAGCGGHTHTTVRLKATPPPTPPTFVCHHKVPAQMGECVRQELEARGIQPGGGAELLVQKLEARTHLQGIDISRWQPHPRFHQLYAEGIRFVIVQGSDNGCACNPFFRSQVRSAHEAGLKVGVYLFAEGDTPSYQAAVLVAVALSERSRIVLGAYVDAEVPAAYPRACAIAHALQRRFFIVGIYGSPGTFSGGGCAGIIIWPAEWGGGSAYPLSGFSFAAIELRQWCGTCRLGGNDGDIDRDEDLGVIARSAPTCNATCVRSRELAKARREATVYLKLIRHHNCASRPLRPTPRPSYRRPCERWLTGYAHRKATIHALIRAGA